MKSLLTKYQDILAKVPASESLLLETNRNFVYGGTIMVHDILNAWAELQRKKDEEGIEKDIFGVAKHIKKQITEVRGVFTKPLNVSDVSPASTQRLIPDSLHLLLRLPVKSDITRVSFQASILNVTMPIKNGKFYVWLRI